MKSRIVAIMLLLVCAAAPLWAACPKDRKGTDFSGRNLTDETLAGQDLRGANFTKATLDGAQFPGRDLTGAVFEGASLAPSAKGPVNFTGATLTGACFQDTTLKDTVLRFARLACTDFSNAVLTEADFGPRPLLDPAPLTCGRAKFAGATLSVRQIPFSSWRFTDFTNTIFVDLTRTTFRGADLTGAILSGAKLAGFDLTGATLAGVDLTEADLRGAKLDDLKAQRIRLDGADLRLATATVKRADLTGAVFRGGLAQDAQLPNALLSSAELRGSNFAGTNLSGAKMDNATLEPGAGFLPAEFAGANLNDVALDFAHLNSVGFNKARMLRAAVTNVTLTDTDFSEATMPNANFYGAKLAGVSFRGSSLENAMFVNATFEVSPATSKSVDFGCTQLGGATFRDLKSKPSAGAVTFLGAVLPDAAECRQEPDGFYCGTELAGQQRYGPTIVPELTNKATCPNGDFLVCAGKSWLLPNWKTTACGQPETRWTPPPPNPPPPGKEVDIPDRNFRQCLSRQFFGVDDAAIPADFAATVQEINCAGRRIADLTGLKAFTDLRKLTLTSNQLVDGEIFGKLTRLQVLQVAENRLTTLNVGVETLKSVTAAGNAIAGVSGLETADLEYLDLSHNQLAEFPLDSQRQIFYADLSHNRLTSIGDLSDGFTALTYLYLQNNDLATIGSLADSRGLTYLSLGSNPRFQCETLEISKELLKASNCGK
jgi:uncharacterized protein YjbI with pentapeptide repeats/Leucine-rich repeat (LRR) protein